MNTLDLKEFRLSKGLSQSALAKKLGKSVRAVQSWEQDVTPIPESVIILINNLFDTDLSVFSKNENITGSTKHNKGSFENLKGDEKLNEIYKLSLAKLSMQENDIKFLNKKVDSMRELINSQNEKINQLTDILLKFSSSIQKS